MKNPLYAPFVCFLVFCLTPFVSSQSPNYTVTPGFSTLPAGAFGAGILASVNDSATSPDFKVCFYTGFTSDPITPASYVSSGAKANFLLNVPTATLQNVPPTSFTQGSFTATIYTVSTTSTTCSGPAAGQTTTPFTLQYPTLQSVSVSSLPQHNPNLSGALPSNLALTGSNFLPFSGTDGKTTSLVNFTIGDPAANSPLLGKVEALTATSIVSSIPTDIPTTATSVTVQACNTAVYSYCSASLTLTLTPLQANSGTVLASPNPASPAQLISISTTFGTASPSVAGAPSGLVTFSDGGNTLGTARLTLDKTATFVPAPAASLTSKSGVISPIVADFNQDGIPDVLFIEPGGTASGTSVLTSPVLHVLLGTTPSGGFAADLSSGNFSKNPCGVVTDASIADFNKDGFPDVALLCSNTDPTTGKSTRVLYALINSGSGTFNQTLLALAIVYGSHIVTGDFNKDGNQDIAVAGALNADNSSIGISLLLGNGAGKFSNGPITGGLDTAASELFGDYQIAAADFNGDGYTDIVVLNGANTQSIPRTELRVLQNNGSGLFLSSFVIDTDGSNTTKFFIASLGVGQRPSLILTSLGSGLSVYPNRNLPDVAFVNPITTTVATFTQTVIGDFNGDGLADAAIYSINNGLQVFLGDGSGSFAFADTGLTLPSQSSSTLLAASDENGDGYADLLSFGTNRVDDSSYAITLHDYITAGTASASLDPLTFSVGTHPIQASTPGTFSILGATSSTTLTIDAAIPVITLQTSRPSSTTYSQAHIVLSATLADKTATGSVQFYDGATLLGTAPLVAGTNAVASFTLPILNAGTYAFHAVYSGDVNHDKSSSAFTPFIISPATPSIVWSPTPSTIAVGTPIVASQLNATASIPGTFTYTPSLGMVPIGGNQILSAAFTPTDAVNFRSVTATTSVIVTRITPTLTWATPTDIPLGVPLSATQLNATATGVGGTQLAGTFSYSPAAGAIIGVGTQKLSVLFTPNDFEDYIPVSGSVSINIVSISLSSITPSTAGLGDPDKPITLTGSVFIPTAVVKVNGVPIATTFVSPSTLTAIVPKAFFQVIQPLQVTVIDPALSMISNALSITMTVPSTSVNFSGPPSVEPATQSSLSFKLAAPYPVDLRATFGLTFSPATGLSDDPNIVFSNGKRALVVTVPANTTDLPAVQFQSGTISGVITLSLVLEVGNDQAGYVNVTPSSIQPIVIQAPVAVPGIISTKLEGEGNSITVVTRGYSNTRKMTTANFHFTPVPGKSIKTPDVTVDVSSIFTTWYASPDSLQYGSQFTYFQTFNLSTDASTIGQVTVTLTNDVGVSPEANTP